MGRRVRTIPKRGTRFRPVPYDDELDTIRSDAFLPCSHNGHLFLQRTDGKAQRLTYQPDVLTAEHFQRELVGHRDGDGTWKPLRLYAHPHDPNYIHIGYDRDPDSRRMWLARQGLTP